ncbi:MAG: hypothetical protein A2Z16_15460 [Chloroflexi bacterium RBG_16_54_18]|nr:MAG: hypothetical protein A2Z16_15460 [Chloroflexi bacterium RBG_16_54_18]
MSTAKSWLICAVLVLVMLVGISFLPSTAYLFGAILAFVIGKVVYETGASAPLPRPAMAMNQPSVQPPTTTRVELPEREMPENLPADLKCPSCGANIKPTDKICAFCGSNLQPLLELPEPAKLGGLEIGNSVRLVHPRKGAQDYRVRGRLLFTELWQASRGPQVPWTPTGNYFAGFALEPAAYLLNWQERFYLLEERRALTDMDINRDFVPYARQFAQSDQTARVEFSYDGALWQMVDIGRFAIEFEDGEGSHLHKGATGRFIHAGSGDQALVVNDFQSGGSGGQDTLWRGFLIKETNITF